MNKDHYRSIVLRFRSFWSLTMRWANNDPVGHYGILFCSQPVEKVQSLFKVLKPTGNDSKWNFKCCLFMNFWGSERWKYQELKWLNIDGRCTKTYYCYNNSMFRNSYIVSCTIIFIACSKYLSSFKLSSFETLPSSNALWLNVFEFIIWLSFVSHCFFHINRIKV